MHKIYHVCRGCWRKVDRCNCNSKHPIRIDKGISHAVMVLNKRGYNTVACCEGHADKSIIYIYVLFTKDYNFQLPSGFKYKDRSLFFIDTKTKDKQKRQEIINNQLQILNAWVDLL
jgi:hypothetical protein